jgi:hypothetical protein
MVEDMVVVVVDMVVEDMVVIGRGGLQQRYDKHYTL